MYSTQFIFCHDTTLVIVNNFYIHGITVFPSETNPPLVVNSDTILTGSIANQLF